MAKVALLIGVSEYREGLKPLPAAPKDVAAMQEVLQNPEMGGFDEVKTLVNPNHSDMAVEIETWFESRQSDDLAVLFFSGHGVKDESRELYFAACDTRLTNKKLIKATAVSARFVYGCLSGFLKRKSQSKQLVVILDCCFSGAFGDLLAKDDGDVDLESQLGTEGGVVLTSSSSLDYSFEQEGSDLSIYTRYLVEGIRTGAADQDGDGAVSVDELHQFASKKVQAAAPAMTPKIIVLKELGYKIKLAKAPIGDPKLKYRKEVECRVYQGKFSIPARRLLKRRRDELGVSSDEADAIEAEVLQPYREHQRKLKEYEDTLAEALQEENPLCDRTRNDLRDYQKHLGLSDEDVKEIEERLAGDKETEYQNKLLLYEQEFLKEVQRIYPLSNPVRHWLKQHQEKLGISDEDAERIEQQILAQKEAQYQKQKVERLEKLTAVSILKPPIPPGTILQNRYRVINILGQGRFGRTYLAEDQGRFNERCVLKELIPPQTGTQALDKSKELFQREAETLYKTKHPQVSQFRANFEQDGRLFLVQDYVEGKTYRELLNDRKAQTVFQPTQGQAAPPPSTGLFSEAEVRQLLLQMLPVLDHIHSKNIIHRDITPDNIILQNSDRMPVLIDFGVVKELATRFLAPADSAPLTTVGKVGYAPSEQIQIGRAYPSSDLYSLAATAVVLLTGKEPQSLFDENQLTWSWRRWVNVSDEFARILNRMLSYRPGDRYQTAMEVLQALQSASTGWQK